MKKTKKEFLITTFDNPFSPFTQFDQWFAFDQAKGYKTYELLDRMSPSSRALSQADQDRIADSSMLTLVKMFPKIYRIVFKEDYPSP